MFAHPDRPSHEPGRNNLPMAHATQSDTLPQRSAASKTVESVSAACLDAHTRFLASLDDNHAASVHLAAHGRLVRKLAATPSIRPGDVAAKARALRTCLAYDSRTSMPTACDVNAIWLLGSLLADLLPECTSQPATI